jgi:phosphoketolase
MDRKAQPGGCDESAFGAFCVFRDPTANILPPEEVRKMDACWRAANCLSVGQIYLMDNPLLKEPPPLEQVKP